MKLSIVPEDNTVVIDGEGVSLDLASASIPSNVHALQWVNSSGQVEYTDGSDEVIDELPSWALSCVTIHEDSLASIVEATQEEVVIDIRDARLKASDWTQVLDAPVDQEAWATYRQALRDIPDQEGFPEDVTWPTKPEET